MTRIKYVILAIFLLIVLVLALRQEPPVQAAQTSSVINKGNSSSVRIPTQRSAFHAANRFWVFFVSNDYTEGAFTCVDFAYRSSTDNVTWNASTTILHKCATYKSFNAAMTDIVFDGTNVHYIRNDHFQGMNYDMLYYRRGVPQSNGTITWAAAEQQVLADGYHANDISLTVDTNGYPWIGMQYSPTYNYSVYGNAYVTKSSTNDGTWSTAFGYPKFLYGTPDNNWLTKVVAQTNGKVYALVYATYGAYGSSPYAYPIYGYAYDGATWGSRETVTTRKLHSRYSGGYFDMFDAIANGDDIYLVFVSYEGKEIRFNKRTSGAWETDRMLVSSSYVTASNTSPVLSKVDSDTINMYWIKKPVIYYLTNESGTWQSSSTPLTFLTDLNIVEDDEHSLQVFEEFYDGFGGLLYMPSISGQRQQTFVSFGEQEIPPPDEVISGYVKTIVIKNNVKFKDNEGAKVKFKN